MKFEATVSLVVEPERGRRCLKAQVVNVIVTQVEEGRIYRFMGSTRLRQITETVDQHRSKVHKILITLL